MSIPEEIDLAVMGAIAAGRAAWPGVHVPVSGFARHLSRPASGAVLHFADLYLAYGCAVGVPAAIRAFEATFLTQVPHFIARTTVDRVIVDEVVQIVRVQLLVADPRELPRIARYSGTGPLGGWVRAAAVRTALNLFRHRRVDDPRRHAAVDPQLPSMLADPEHACMKVELREVLRGCLASQLADLPSSDRAILRLYYLESLTIEQVAAILCVHRTTVMRRLGRLRVEVLDRVCRAMADRLRVSATEAARLIAVAKTGLDASMSRLLAA